MKMIEVGKYEKKMVTPLNHELYKSAVDIIDNSQHEYHIGWSGVGLFIDWLEENYEIRKKGEKVSVVNEDVARGVASKFNGNLIMELTPLRGIELGEFINAFKEEVASNVMNVDTWILDTPQEEINDVIKTFYLEFYK